jgi:hypothetical protein
MPETFLLLWLSLFFLESLNIIPILISWPDYFHFLFLQLT